ncbi:IucA/IucC family protein [Streptomyces sp. NPDC087844]|uniref:IucA/IucC family protein n=1 Tax=Streptomyces sp. NPDC087844 TaxID=3365805 RepID=UPI0037FB0327
MNATPASDGRPQPHERAACRPQAPLGPGAESVPRQKGGARKSEGLYGATTDLLEHPDPHTAAQAAAVENLLRCWVREHDLPAPADGTLRIPLPASGTALVVPVQYWSLTGWHRLGPPHLASAPDQAPPTDAVTLAALLGREIPTHGIPTHEIPTHEIPTHGTPTHGTPTHGTPTHGAPTHGTPAYGAPTASVESASASASAHASAEATTPTAPGATTAAASAYVASAAATGFRASVDDGDLVGRVADSLRRTVVFIRDRRENPADGSDLFLSAEQSLLLGHPLHPTPKSREGLSVAENRLYSPELRGSFALHWMAVAPSVLATGSAWTERGRPVPAEQLTSRLAGAGLQLPESYAALPMHPWQLREVHRRSETGRLLTAGLLRDLGPHGSPWHPTSSVRTLYRSGAPAMLKLSLGLRITNSRRENLRKEFHRGVEVHRLLRAGLADQWQATHPGFDIVRDPAWLAVNETDGTPVTGLDVMIRHNPFTPTDDVSCIAGLVSPRLGSMSTGQRHPEPTRSVARSRLTEIVTRLAGRTGRPRGAVAAEWFLRYLEHVVRPVLWLDSEAGIALEAHQQNTLLLLDPEGWPRGGRYRDNQGYYFRESRRAELNERLPGIGEHSDTFVSDAVTDERFAYYLAINNVLGLIGAFGSQRLADERLLLAAFRRFLTDVASGPARLRRTTLPALLLDSPVLRCKANLLTRLHGLDELVGPVDTQSVYVTIANPLHS